MRIVAWARASGTRFGARLCALGCLIGLVLLLVLLVDAARLDLDGPAPSLLLLDRQGRFIAEMSGVADGDNEFGYWPLQELPPRVVAATLALEDRRFATHPGVDVLALARAVYQNLSHRRRVSGASTLAMQLARARAPASASGGRSYWNKVREAWHALVLTVRFGRQEVLHAYLRQVPYGNRVHGIAYAARRYLDKPVADLSWAEIAFLCAIPQAPSNMNPFREDGRLRAIARGQRLLQQLHAQSVISPGDYEFALQQIRDIRLPPLTMRPAHSLHAVFKLQQLLATAPPVGGPEPYRVITTLDLDVQQEVADRAAEAVAQWRPQGVGNAAVILLDRATNGVLAWLGSTNYFDAVQAGAIDFARTPRSPGSALKPFFYALALERGRITPASILDDLPDMREGIANADRAYLGPLLPRQALANSRNVPAARLLNELGLQDGFDFLRDLELHHNAHDAQHYGLGLVIGTLPVTLESLVQAYTVLAHDGQWRALHWYHGQSASVRQLLAPGVARLVSLQLADASARLPTFPRMGSTEYPFPVALKTGSSQGLRDAWTVAYSRRYLLGVWLGHPDARPMHEVSGGTHAAELAHRILTHLHRDQRHGFADLGFPAPQGYHLVPICARTGKRATPACDTVFEEWFKPGQEPQQEDDAHLRLAVDVRNGLLAHANTPQRFVEQRTFISLPPRYAQWAAQSGLPRAPQTVSTLGENGHPALPEYAQEHVPVTRFTAAGLAVRSLSQPLRILAPGNGLRLIRDATLPPGHNTIALQVEADPSVPEVLWSVDGKPYKLAPHPYAVRWPLQPGEHVIQASVPTSHESSAMVRIRVD